MPVFFNSYPSKKSKMFSGLTVMVPDRNQSGTLLRKIPVE